MKMQMILLSLVVSIVGSSAFADFDLSKKVGAVVCSAADNTFITLNAKRTTVKYSVEGESNGPQKVKQVQTDGQTSISYITEEGTLTLSNQGDTYQYDGDQEPGPVDCE